MTNCLFEEISKNKPRLINPDLFVNKQYLNKENQALKHGSVKKLHFVDIPQKQYLTCLLALQLYHHLFVKLAIVLGKKGCIVVLVCLFAY